MSAVRKVSSVPAFGAQPRALQFVAACVVTVCADSSRCLLRCEAWDGSTLELQAWPAAGLLLLPAVGDQVLCVPEPSAGRPADSGERWLIVQVLLRASAVPLQFCSQQEVEWLAPAIRLRALRELELTSAGKLHCHAIDLVFSAGRTLVQQARHLLQQAGDFSLTAKGLLRLSGKQQLITAEDDVRVDGKRISMG